MLTHTSKEQRQTPNNAQWCLSHASSLSLNSSALQIDLCEYQCCMARYRAILDKYFDNDAKGSLLAKLKRWTLSMDCTDFWKKQVLEKMISDTHAPCTTLVDLIIIEETPYLTAETNLASDTTSTSNTNTVQLDINEDKNIRSDQNNVSYKNSANVDQHDNTNLNNKTDSLEGEEKRKFRGSMDVKFVDAVSLLFHAHMMCD
ncbi:hypothetical protein G6F70_000933 [Rhizopus microsporus]|uniref:Uncharacterized protein n=2 Tax=Rhizopus TaxID=4842 RepID=A0A367JY23_RHIAZ|nr:hypothetical protein G6F71_000647 [Rhizopus microsporus]RCH94830.1 hypothetical protein CU097_009682 [Rhizopus azygosporus]KAG1203936.1 hypothetical protein G6F70_000933 [Rhizopus microsporus]KAG1214711.1 hypothetical protein G6F69_001669 [Rhizopus microsporus]KAG1235843.1 hypothetical protein G6F67_002453 [Rhizopus microsporus]